MELDKEEEEEGEGGVDTNPGGCGPITETPMEADDAQDDEFKGKEGIELMVVAGIKRCVLIRKWTKGI